MPLAASRSIQSLAPLRCALLWRTGFIGAGFGRPYASPLSFLLVRSGSAVDVASRFFLTPLATARIARALFGETLSGIALFGMGIAVAAVYLSRR